MEADIARWIRCKHPLDPNNHVVINLEQVVSLTSFPGGSMVLYPGAQAAFPVASTPDEILKDEDWDSA